MNQKSTAPSPKGGPLTWWPLGLAGLAGAIMIYAAIPPALPDAQELLGKWLRQGGQYTLEIRSISPSGLADVGYFNPQPINVSKASISTAENRLKLDVELQDEGYPGSSYALFYDPESGRLVGRYIQAQGNQTFEVSFSRQTETEEKQPPP